MTIYTVHVYREMRLVFPGIEASTPEAAARLAAAKPTYSSDEIDHCEGRSFSARVQPEGSARSDESRTVTLRADGGEIEPAPEHVTNRDRAKWAEACVSVFMRHTGCDREDALGDLFCDLMHWAVQERFDLSAALERALGHFEAELVEEGHIPAALAASDGRGRFEHAATPLLGTIFHLVPVQDPDPEPTPGPWEYNDVGLVYGHGQGDDDGAPFVCDVALDSSMGLSPREKANARLIAAAPEMREAVDMAESELERMEAITGHSCDLQVMTLLRAAIAKAKGGAQ